MYISYNSLKTSLYTMKTNLCSTFIFISDSISISAVYNTVFHFNNHICEIEVTIEPY